MLDAGGKCGVPQPLLGSGPPVPIAGRSLQVKRAGFGAARMPLAGRLLQVKRAGFGAARMPLAGRSLRTSCPSLARMQTSLRNPCFARLHTPSRAHGQPRTGQTWCLMIHAGTWMLNAGGADVEEHQVYPHRSDDASAPPAAMRRRSNALERFPSQRNQCGVVQKPFRQTCLPLRGHTGSPEPSTFDPHHHGPYCRQ